MSARLARRKEKVVYEEIPIVTQQTVPPKDMADEHVDTTPTVGGVVNPNAPTPNRIITNDTVEHEGYLEPMKRVAAQYKPAPVVSIPIPPPVEFDDEEPIQGTKSAVTNIQDRASSPIDETIPGYGRIFGGKRKEPIVAGV